MSLQAAYDKYKTGKLWKTYASSNPKEAAQIDTYVGGIISGAKPRPPLLATATGSGLVEMLDSFIYPVVTPVQDDWTKFTKMRDFIAPPFLPSPIVKNYSVPSDALNAINNIKSNESIRLAPNMVIPGRVILPAISLVSPAEVQCNGAVFTGVDNSQSLKDGRWDTIFSQGGNVRMFDGVISKAANMGIRLYGGAKLNGFYRFKVYGTNGNGVGWNPVNGDIVDCDFTGEVYSCGIQWWVDQFDPHAERGTGTHCFYNGGTSTGKVLGPRIYIHGHDQHYGCVVQVNTIYESSTRVAEIAAYGQRATFKAQVQVAGNVIQPWGDNGKIVFPFIYGEDCTGRGVDTNVNTPDTAYSGMTVLYGRHKNMCLAPSPGEGNIPQSVVWDTRRGIVYKDVD